EYFKVGTPHIKALFRAFSQDEDACNVYGQADHGNEQHRSALHFRRIPEALVSLIENVKGDADENNGVCECREDFDAVVAIGSFWGRRAFGESDGEQGET